MSHPDSLEAKQILKDTEPFKGLRLSDNAILNRMEGRHPCPECGKSRKYFCYTCYVPLTEVKGNLPKIDLPIQIDIIKHQHEIDGKSTASHAAILAPDHVQIYTYPNIPDYQHESGVVLIFPSFDAIEIRQLFENENWNEIKPDCEVMLPKGMNKSTLMKQKYSISSSFQVKPSASKSNTLPIGRAVFIDSTWNQSKGIYKDVRINRLPTVVLQNRISQFWRHQKGSPRWYLATIEAIHQFLLEIHLNMWGVHPNYDGLSVCFTENYLDNFKIAVNENESAYCGQYDDLLFFFQHMFDLIHKYYDHQELFAYKRRLQ